MDEIKQRLKEASDACVTTYEAWRSKPGEGSAREALQEAVHELRKVAARLEIELAVSDRKQQGNDPIPIPSHRASRRPAQGADLDFEDDNRPGRPSGNRDGNRDFSRRSVHIRRPQDNGGDGNTAPQAAASAAASAASGAAQPGNEAAPAASGDDAPRRGKPLSLKRSGGESE